jgi:hypothetical protein
MATGYEQVRSVAAWLDGDLEAGRRVELNLPETGVCSSGIEGGGACCGGPAVDHSNNNDVKVTYDELNLNLKSEDMKTDISKNGKSKIEEAGCCGGAPKQNEDACCKLDEEKKAEGLSGCGCNAPAPAGKKTTAASCC